jgi:hypothetical protein
VSFFVDQSRWNCCFGISFSSMLPFFLSFRSWRYERVIVLFLILVISTSIDPLNLSLSKILNSHLLQQVFFQLSFTPHNPQHSYSPLSEEDHQASLRSGDLKLLCGKSGRIGPSFIPLDNYSHYLRLSDH